MEAIGQTAGRERPDVSRKDSKVMIPQISLFFCFLVLALLSVAPHG